MKNWAQAVEGISASDGLHIAPFRADGSRCGTPTWIWSVVVDGRLFVRAWNGQVGTAPRWRREPAAAGETHEVESGPGDPELNGRIDEAYRRKYAGSPYLPPMLAAGPRTATVEVAPSNVFRGIGKER